MNPIIRGWSNYHRHIAAKATFAALDSQIYRYLRDWAKRRHPHKGKRWLTKKYWHSTPVSTYFSVIWTGRDKPAPVIAHISKKQ